MQKEGGAGPRDDDDGDANDHPALKLLNEA